MGTICILFGLAIFLGSLFLGFSLASWVYSTFATSLVGLVPGQMELTIMCVGIFGFIGLLICLNLVMHGLTYNKVVKLSRRLRNHWP